MKDNTPRSVFNDVRRSVDPQAADKSGMFYSVPIWELWRVARTNMAATLTCGRAANEASRQGRRHGGAWGGVAPSLGLSRPLTQDECENRFYLWNIIVYLKNTVAKWIGFLALIWCDYSKNLGQSVSQSRILITSDTQTCCSTKCRHYAAHYWLS